MSRTQAIVCSTPAAHAFTPGDNWHMQDVLVPTEIADTELLVEIVASGICHTDLLITAAAGLPGITFPRIAGHEGAGYVKAIGPKVTKDVGVGDPVLLSFTYCTECDFCTSDRPAACEKFMPMNLAGQQDTFKAVDGEGQGIAGKFFGQSSLAKLTIVEQACVLPAKNLIRNEEELKLFAPLGCGVMTGAGSVLNVAKATKYDTVLVIGLGGVGLSALMASVIVGCRQIIALDRVPSRIELAKSLGATSAINTSDVDDLAATMKAAAPTVIIDTSGVPSILQAAYDALAAQGTLVLVGAITDGQAELKVNMAGHLSKAQKLIGCIEGDSLPVEFIPRLIEYYRAGKFPIDRFIKFYEVDDFKRALHDMHSGETVKPVLVW